ncbi:MAG: tetratricopeptide repeat protein [Mastigocoleus sp.]|mgnify:CR=1 FL=1
MTAKKHQGISTFTYRAFALLVTVFLMTEVGTVYAGINLEIIAQKEENSQSSAKQKEVIKLTDEGFKLFKQGTPESLVAARKKFEASLVLWRELKHPQEEAGALFLIGQTYSRLGERKKGLQYYQQALILQREIKDKRGEAGTLNSMGSDYLNLGENQKALESFKQLLLLQRARENKLGEGVALNNIGFIYSNLGENQKALEIFKQVLKLRREIGDRKGEAITLNHIGGIYSDFGNKRKALEYYNQALTLHDKLDNKVGKANALNNIGLVYSNLGEKQKALKFYNQALSLYSGVEDRGGEATTLNNIGLVYSHLGEKQKALEYYNRGLSLFRQLKDRSGEAKTLTNIGGVYSDLGYKFKALEYYNQALPVFQFVEDIDQEAITLNNIGLIYSFLGEQQKALESFNQALPVFRTVKNRGMEATTLNNMGAVYNTLGEKEKALSLFTQALPLLRSVGNKAGEASTLSNMGLLYSRLGDKQKALGYYQQALPLLRQIADRNKESAILNNIGQVYSDLGSQQKALENLQQALKLTRVVKDPPGEATTLNNIAAIYDALGNHKLSLEYFKRALPLYSAVGEKDGEANTLLNLAKLERKQGNLQVSLKHITSAIQIIEKLHGTYTNPDLKTSYFSTVQGYYKFYILLLMDLHKKDPSKGHDALALHISERSRARALIELLAQANAKVSKNVDPKLIAEEKELQFQRQNQEKILAQLSNQTKPPKDSIQKTELEIQNIINQQKQLKAKIRAQNPERDKITNPKPLKLPQIQQQLDKDTVLLQYSLGEERSYLWLVTPTSLSSYELPKGEEIEKIAKRFHQDLGQATTADSLAIESAQKLSQIILAPIKDKIAGKRLVIVGDGILQQIPFAALANPNNNKKDNQQSNNQCGEVTCNVSTNNKQIGIKVEPNNKPNNNNTNYQPLIINHEIVNLPSASTIAIQREKTTNRKIAPKKIAILADPVYSPNDERVTGKAENIIEEIDLERSALKRSAKSLNRRGWTRLPNTATEAKTILKLVSDKYSLPAFSFDANYKWATSKNLSQYQILHFATHGFVNPDQPELSGIVLSLVNKEGQQIPGYLRLADLFEQDYPAELIVLSACETGLGKNVNGEGLVGLTRGLMYAGAERIALSLWQVDDKGTSVLMQEFYRQMLQENKTPPQALRDTQRKLWSNPEWRNPYYWAAFTLQGEWK